VESPQDRIARAAALLIASRREREPGEAIAQAARDLHLESARPPSLALVRRHSQALAMQALGAEAYADLSRRVQIIAEEVMTLLDLRLGAPVLLTGRAARGERDAGATISLRVGTDEPIGLIADLIRDQGYEDPVVFSAPSRFGMLDALRFHEQECEVTIRRCPPARVPISSEDLVTGRTVATLTLEALRREL